MHRIWTTVRRLWVVVPALTTLVALPAAAPAPAPNPLVGKRVYTLYEFRPVAPSRAAGRAEGEARIYRVVKAEGARLWLVGEESNVRGWLDEAFVIPFEKAIDYYTNKLDRKPTPFAFINRVLAALNYTYRGLAWWDRGDYDAAIRDFGEVIRLDPRQPLGYD
jgi:tetratricopeptide (TPR) repeat protein